MFCCDTKVILKSSYENLQECMDAIPLFIKRGTRMGMNESDASINIVPNKYGGCTLTVTFHS